MNYELGGMRKIWVAVLGVSKASNHNRNAL